MSPSSSGEKTEKATSKKRRDARKEGQVMKSQDLVIAFSMAVLLGALKIFGPMIVGNLKGVMERMLTWDIPDVMTGPTVMNLFTEVVLYFALAVLPMLLAAMLVGVVFNVLQVGFMFTPKAMMPKFSRINPLEGFKRMFSKKTLIELLKSIVKIAVLGLVAYSEYQKLVIQTPGMMGETVDSIILSATTAMNMIFSIGFKLALALIVMAPFDLYFQWWKYEKDLMMTKQEVKDEYKLTEGDPKIKSRIKQKQREMSAMRMMQAVADADVVITNPTHYAVALRYKEGQDNAPVVVAKGKDFLAKRIRDEADAHSIPKVENKPLAQSLYFFCDLGDEVPENLYQAVAEVLAYIYRLKNNATRRRGVR